MLLRVGNSPSIGHDVDQSLATIGAWSVNLLDCAEHVDDWLYR